MPFTTDPPTTADQTFSSTVVNNALIFFEDRIRHNAFISWLATCLFVVFAIAVMCSVHTLERRGNELGKENQILQARIADLEEEVVLLQGDEAQIEAYCFRKLERERRCAKPAENNEVTSLLRRVCGAFNVDNSWWTYLSAPSSRSLLSLVRKFVNSWSGLNHFQERNLWEATYGT
jgi:hypothetical protein